MSAELLDELRPRAFAIAYRMLGSVSEAEDVVQEGLIRLDRALDEGEEIESPSAYLSTVVARLAIDELRSARTRRETYVGEWLPEPVLTDEQANLSDATTDPAQHAEMADSLSLAFLVLLESLSPEQRAVFLLHDVFDYPYERIAEIIGKSEENARQLAARARRHVDQRSTRFDPSKEQREELADRFMAAVQEGEVEKLEELLAEDVVLHGDGGGKAPALARPVVGRRRAAGTFSAWIRVADRIGGISFRRVEVNGQPGAITTSADGSIINVLVLDIAEGQVQGVRSVVNPDKLGHLGRVADIGALLRESSS
jgi:RNA polymerase sigma-70 factor (ECF subfamily)